MDNYDIQLKDKLKNKHLNDIYQHKLDIETEVIELIYIRN